MEFAKTKIPGVVLIDLEKRVDERGHFARAWCREEFERAGLNASVVQINTAVSQRAGTIRGMHFQEEPFAEVKLARCLRGAIFDVAVDLRPDSPTYRQWVGCELSAENGRMLYIPEGCAHGYQTLVEDTEMSYQTSQVYAPSAATGVRFDDPALGIEWPLAVTAISDADRNWSVLEDCTSPTL